MTGDGHKCVKVMKRSWKQGRAMKRASLPECGVKKENAQLQLKLVRP